MTSFLDAKQEREDLLSMARIMHHLAWCAVNEEWVNEPQQLDSMLFVASNTLPYRRFADALADACAQIGGDVDCYSFIAVDFHHILLASLPAHSLALRPAHSRCHQFVTR